MTSEEASADTEKPTSKTEFKYDTSKKLLNKSGTTKFCCKIGMGAGKVVATFNQSACEGVQTMINTVIPFMAFVFINCVIQGSGIGEFCQYHGAIGRKHCGVNNYWFYLFSAVSPLLGPEQ